MSFNDIKLQLKQYTVGIAGAGGLGSNCAIALARSGIGKLIIADFDIITDSNLNRQYYFSDQLGMKKVIALKHNISRLNTNTIVEVHDLRLNQDNIPQLFDECDIIVEAFDRSDMKEMLGETALSIWPEKTLIMGSGLAGWGNTNKLRERYIGKNLIICGDEQSEVSEEEPPLAPRVGIVANMQANAVIEILLNHRKDENYAE